MKKVLSLVILAALSHVSGAQSEDAIISLSNDTVVPAKSKSIEERLDKQEQELQALKRDNESLKKEFKQLKSAINIGGKRRVTISRIGSKQVIAE